MVAKTAVVLQMLFNASAEIALLHCATLPKFSSTVGHYVNKGKYLLDQHYPDGIGLLILCDCVDGASVIVRCVVNLCCASFVVVGLKV